MLRPDKLSPIWVSEASHIYSFNSHLDSSGHILEAANCTFDNVVKTTVLLADINDFGAVNEVYTTFFKDNYPARAAYQVRGRDLFVFIVFCFVRWRLYRGEPGWR